MPIARFASNVDTKKDNNDGMTSRVFCKTRKERGAVCKQRCALFSTDTHRRAAAVDGPGERRRSVAEILLLKA